MCSACIWEGAALRRCEKLEQRGDTGLSCVGDCPFHRLPFRAPDPTNPEPRGVRVPTQALEPVPAQVGGRRRGCCPGGGLLHPLESRCRQMCLPAKVPAHFQPPSSFPDALCVPVPQPSYCLWPEETPPASTPHPHRHTQQLPQPSARPWLPWCTCRPMACLSLTLTSSPGRRWGGAPSCSRWVCRRAWIQGRGEVLEAACLLPKVPSFPQRRQVP